MNVVRIGMSAIAREVVARAALHGFARATREDGVRALEGRAVLHGCGCVSNVDGRAGAEGVRS